MPDKRNSSIVRALLRFAREQLDVHFDNNDSVAAAFALACIARCSDLLEGQLTLYEAEQWSVARVLGRTLIEFWLYGQYFILGGDEAVDQLLGEDLRHQGALELGRRQIWDRLESAREGGVDLRTGFVQPEGARRQRLDLLAQNVRKLRVEHGYGGGIAEVRYEASYRWESDHEVHPTFDLLTRYFRPVHDGTFRVVAIPEVLGDRDLSAVINDDLRSDATLLGDLLGLYLQQAGDFAAIKSLRPYWPRHRDPELPKAPPRRLAEFAPSGVRFTWP